MTPDQKVPRTVGRSKHDGILSHVPTVLILKWSLIGRCSQDWFCPVGYEDGRMGGGNKLRQAGHEAGHETGHETGLVLGVRNEGRLSQAGPQTGAARVWPSELDSRSSCMMGVVITLVKAASCQYKIPISSCCSIPAHILLGVFPSTGPDHRKVPQQRQARPLVPLSVITAFDYIFLNLLFCSRAIFPRDSPAFWPSSGIKKIQISLVQLECQISQAIIGSPLTC